MQIQYLDHCDYQTSLSDYLTNHNNIAVICMDDKYRNTLLKQFGGILLTNNIIIYTIDDLNSKVFVCNPTHDDVAKTPLLIAEDKRTIAFYQALLTSDKNSLNEKLRINNYFQSIKPAQDFYNLFEEINLNMLSEQDICCIISNAEQLQLFDNFCLIKQRLFDYLSSRGLTDKIFVKTKSTLEHNIKNAYSLFDKYEHILFLDVYAEDKLTQYLLTNISSYLSKKINDKPILTMMTTFKKSQLNPDFSLHLSENDSSIYKSDHIYNIEKIEIFNAKDSIESYLQLAHIIKQNKKINTIVDFDAGNDIYPLLLSPDKYKTKKTLKMIDTCLYVYLDMMYKLINGIEKSKNGTVDLIDIFVFFDCVNTNEFIDFYLDKFHSSIICGVLTDMINNGYIYVDKNFTTILDILNEKITDKDLYESIKNGLNHLTDDIVGLMNTTNLTEFRQYLDNKIIKNRHFYKESNPQIFDNYFTAIEDILTIEHSKIVDAQSWKKFFNNQYGFSCNFIKLLLDYLKSKSLILNVPFAENGNGIGYFGFNFYDVHLQNSDIFLINLNDKTFPNISLRNNFFSDSQRLALGLYTLDDYVCLQRVLFRNILANNKNIYLMYIENENIDCFGSGIVDEIKFYCAKHNIKCIVQGGKDDTNNITFNDKYNDLLNVILNNNSKSVLYDPSCRQKQEYNLEFDINKDLKVSKESNNLPIMSLSHSTLKTLKDNPTQFYLEKIIGLKPLEINRVPCITETLLGNIVHHIYSDLFKFDNPITLDDNMLNDKEIDKKINEKIDKLYFPYKNSFLYMVPNDFNKTFLKNIIFPFVIRQANNFVKQLNQLFDSDSLITFIPEENFDEAKVNEINDKAIIFGSDFELSDEKKEKEPCFTEIQQILSDMSFKLTGRADLRLESGTKKIIIDYKTGKEDYVKKEQLNIYRYIYYKDNPSDGYFYLIFDKGQLSNKGTTNEDQLKNSICDVIYDAIKPILLTHYWQK